MYYLQLGVSPTVRNQLYREVFYANTISCTCSCWTWDINGTINPFKIIKLKIENEVINKLSRNTWWENIKVKLTGRSKQGIAREIADKYLYAHKTFIITRAFFLLIGFIIYRFCYGLVLNGIPDIHFNHFWEPITWSLSFIYHYFF